MSLFNPIRGQYKRLMEVLQGLPAIPVSQAAKLMRVPAARVAGNLEKMKRKGLFTVYQPFVQPGLQMVVLGDAYLPFAAVCQEGDALLRDTRQAMSLLQQGNTVKEVQQKVSSARSRAVGSFVHDLLDINGTSWGAGFKGRARGLLRDLIDPSGLVQEEENHTRTALGVLTSLENYLESMFNYLFSHPNLVSQKMLPTLQGTHRDLNAYLSSLPAAQGGSRTWNMQAENYLRVIREDDLPRIAALMDDMYAHTEERKQQQKKENPVLDELAQEIYRLETLANQLPGAAIMPSLRNIAEKLSRIRQLLIQSPEKSALSCVRSLRECYLPMTDELLSKYMQSLSLSSPSSEAAVKATENVFSGVLPQALQQILEQLETDNVNDMRSQADAFVRKLQLDGLLPYNYQSETAGQASQAGQARPASQASQNRQVSQTTQTRQAGKTGQAGQAGR